MLVHGLIGTLNEPDLLGHFEPVRVLAPDLLGYGRLGDTAPARITLRAQVAHLAETVDRAFGAEPVHVVGHSVGGAAAMLLAHDHPERVRSVVNVEGNFTLNDAFWSASVAEMSEPDVERVLAGFRTDPAAWLARSGVDRAGARDTALRWLAHQPAATVRAMARAVVRETTAPEYLETLRSVFRRHPVHLLAGERSAGAWDVPDWARALAASSTVIPGTGHLMMVERPADFAAAVRRLTAA